MANCHNLFLDFNRRIQLSEEKRITLIEARDSLRTRISSSFFGITKKDNFNHKLDFQSQGSFVMDTIIQPKDDDFDLDDGIYLIGSLNKKDRPSVKQYHKWVIESIGQFSGVEKIEEKTSCIRVKYKNLSGKDAGFHIDLPCYYTDNIECPDLGCLENEWTLSNPVEFIEWFEKKTESGFKKAFLYESLSFKNEYKSWLSDIRKKDVQLRRIVRYLKAWGDELRGEMPPGIVMTILAGENYCPNERDDLSLRDTLTSIKSWLHGNGFKCPRPTEPKGQDLFENYSDTRKKYFSDRLDSFINRAKQAINNQNQKEACLLWKQSLGNRFPCSLAIDEIEGAKQYIGPAVIKSDDSRSAK
ncbi:hypothetical protein DFQ04_2767 [Algoriphagus boseongensis]|uniref:Cyclic GMP-AMP synthase n=1 Tax=Algoriphagus boseongensis TaxID=1442587 RepID=A0A4R6T585_9BACT|nr:hypothetical protein [Algoriphagus boseongensis]TDQ16645.1 hypothetical protein DFQ04_2767 [Algoriphagus boseongensis]